MDRIDLGLLNDFQRDFPLVSRPFRALGQKLGASESEVLRRIGELLASGVISRVGAVFAPGCIGSSTLGALRVPAQRLDDVAALVSALPEVNHNYAREHHYNLWFVATAFDRGELDRLLARIEADAACPLLDLPMIEEYRIDLGFDLTGLHRDSASCKTAATPRSWTEDERRILRALQGGLPAVAEPFRALAAQADLPQVCVLAALDRWIADGLVRRFGVIVRHHELGFRANCMAVWDVPDDAVARCGRRAARVPAVTLAYRRRRQLPAWPYNLFCMVHGKERDLVEQRVQEIISTAGLDEFAHALLFSTRRFKQSGARYLPAEALNAHG